MDKKIKKVPLSWEDIETTVKLLSKKLSGQKFDAIVSIGRGGMVPARLLAEKFDIHSAYIIDAKAYNDDDTIGEVKVSDIKFAPDIHKILVVDDCIFSGATLTVVMQKISENEQITDIVNAFLYKNSKMADVVEDYVYARKYDGSSKWLVFPWENK